MDIQSKGKYPSNSLSNFAPHPFEIDGVKCNSMEGFLQSLKFSSSDMQAHICTLVGFAAKRAGAKKNWQTTQTLWWRGQPIKRDSQEYQNLLDRAYDALAKNDSFRKALIASGNATLTHSMGRRKINETVLTQQEFCSRLMRVRREVQLDDVLTF